MGWPVETLGNWVMISQVSATGSGIFLFLDTVLNFPRWEMKSLSEGYERAVDQNWDRMAKIGIFGPKKTYTSVL